MDEQKQQQINEAAEQFAEAVKESYQTMADRGQSAQELNAQLAQQFFSSVNEHLRTHAEANREMTQQLLEQQQRQQEAGQQIAQESVGAYMDFVNSMFSVSQGAAQEGAKQAKK
jgi:putative cell wall-binding protein